jgi:two-component system LytT family response regulator
LSGSSAFAAELVRRRTRGRVAGDTDGDHDLAIIFATAHEQYARRAFDVDAIDYLLKPVDPARLAEALRLVRRRTKPTRIAARTGNRIRFVDPDDIDWIETEGNYVAVHAGGGSS